MPKTDPHALVFYIYILFDWLGIPRYVGMGKDQRWTDHEHQIDKHNPIKQAFIDRTLAIIGEIPKIKVAENLTRIEANELECLFIKIIGRKKDGGPLTNLSNGGDGGDFGEAIRKTKANWSPQMRKHVSDQRSEIITRAWNALPEEEKERRRRRSQQDLLKYSQQEKDNPSIKEKRVNAIKAGKARRTPEQRAETKRKQAQSFSSERQSKSIKQWHSNMPSEKKIARGLKISRTLTGKPFRGDRNKLSGSIKKSWTNPDYRNKQMLNRINNPSSKGRIWITDGTKAKRIYPNTPIPIGWNLGRKKKDQ